MTDIVPTEDIERIVGAKRHPSVHLARAVSAEQTVYILHAQGCLDMGDDLRDCIYSLALDNGIRTDEWVGMEDRAVVVNVVGQAGQEERLKPFCDASELAYPNA